MNGFEAVKEELSFAIFSVERDTDKTDDSISEAENFARIKKCIQAARLAKSIKEYKRDIRDRRKQGRR